MPTIDPETGKVWRTQAEDSEVTELLRTYDRTLARLDELGIDLAKVRPPVVREEDGNDD